MHTKGQQDRDHQFSCWSQLVHVEARAVQPIGLLMERLSPADYLDDPLTAHPRYSKIKDLNEGTFGVVVLAQDVRIKEPVRYLLHTCAVTLRGVRHLWRLLCMDQHGWGVSLSTWRGICSVQQCTALAPPLLPSFSCSHAFESTASWSIICRCLLTGPVVCAGSYKGVKPSLYLAAASCLFV